ncbi:MAG TPA: pitrilysin family protein [Pyrinomonadaceae bacterium]|nr:pitrilysin family protein [Pyrinomonadaceae bacterium]
MKAMVNETKVFASFGSRASSWLLALALLAASLTNVASAQTSGADALPARTPEQVESVGASRRIVESARLVTELDVNGLKVLVKRRLGSQTVVTGLFLRGGSRNLTAENAGVEALMLDVATEASENFPRERFRRELSRIGTSISYGVNYDYSGFVMGSTRKHFDRSWEIFTDAALRPSFTPDDFQRVKGRTLASLSDNEDTPDSYLQELQSRVAYAGHPYMNEPRGSVASVTRLTVEDVKRYHKQAMQTSRLLLVVVGDVDPQEIRRKVESSLGKLPRGDYKPSPLPPLSFSAPTLAVTQRAIPTNYVQGVFAAPPLTSADIYPMRIASSILQNRVYLEVRVRRNLSYAPDAFLRDQGANTGGIYVTAVDANQAVRVMLSEIARLQREPISANELTATTQSFLTRHYLGQETNAAQGGELAQYELIGGGWRNSSVFLERLRAVTPEEVQRVANTYMRNLQFVVIGDPRQIDRGVFTHQAGE